jgi:hypothetical protein
MPPRIPSKDMNQEAVGGVEVSGDVGGEGLEPPTSSV